MLSRLRAIPDVHVVEHPPLARYTRFALGGPARALADASTEAALASAIACLESAGQSWTLIGGGSNLVVSDAGFEGVVLRYAASSIRIDGTAIHVESGAVLQALVDASIAAGLQGLETMTGIPGWVGGAVYGNAGAYGHSIQERIRSIRFFDGRELREFSKAQCEFAYRESIFKRHKDWLIVSAELAMNPGDPAQLAATATGILKIRNEKYPPSLRCAGSIFKNLILQELPESVQARIPAAVIREGKVPSAYFLEQVGAKGRVRGGIRVADYHANLIFNDGTGTSADLTGLIRELKSDVADAYGLPLEEEVQYVGQFAPLPIPVAAEKST